MMTFEKINPSFIEFEGFYYLEFEGEFYKGCRRCGGEGHYSHNGEHSRCYDCDNTSAKLGERLPSREAAEKWCHVRALGRANRERKANAKAQAARDARDARVEKMLAEEPEIHALLKKVYDDENEAYRTNDYSKISKSGFLRDMASNLFNATGRDLTDNMISALRRMIDSDKARNAERAAKVANGEVVPVVEGRVEITGTVVSTKVVESDFGVGYKMIIQDERGFRVYGSIPKNIQDEIFGIWLEEKEKAGYSSFDFGGSVWLEAMNGLKVKFTATVERSSKDEFFGFFKRPVKAEVVA